MFQIVCHHSALHSFPFPPIIWCTLLTHCSNISSTSTEHFTTQPPPTPSCTHPPPPHTRYLHPPTQLSKSSPGQLRLHCDPVGSWWSDMPQHHKLRVSTVLTLTLTFAPTVLNVKVVKIIEVKSVSLRVTLTLTLTLTDTTILTLTGTLLLSPDTP
jgi:hypothetical protein